MWPHGESLTINCTHRNSAPCGAMWQPPSADLIRIRRSGGLAAPPRSRCGHIDAQPRPPHSCTSLVRGARPGDRRDPSAIHRVCERPGALDRSSISGSFLVGCAGRGASRGSRAPCRAQGGARARMVAHAQDWPWSSVRAHLDGRDDEWVRIAPCSTASTASPASPCSAPSRRPSRRCAVRRATDGRSAPTPCSRDSSGASVVRLARRNLDEGRRGTAPRRNRAGGRAECRRKYHPRCWRQQRIRRIGKLSA
jgi:hypothetical protein